MRSGVTLNPATSLLTLEEILPYVDLVLVMSVNPGFGGQSYIPTSTAKIARLRAMLDALGSAAELEVDGGIKPNNAAEVVAAGATVLVAGSAIFGGPQGVAEHVAAFQRELGIRNLRGGRRRIRSWELGIEEVDAGEGGHWKGLGPARRAPVRAVRPYHRCTLSIALGELGGSGRR